MSFLSKLGKSLLGDVASGLVNSAFGAMSMRQQSKAQYNLWSQQQSNAHQLEVQDLKAAGLNPILSAGSGQVVSQPSVSPSNENSDINSAMSAMFQAEIANTNAETERIKAETDAKRQKVEESKSASDIKVNEETIKKIQAETTSEGERLNLIKEQILSVVKERENSSNIAAATVRQLDSLAYNLSAMVEINNKKADAEIRKADKEVEVLQADLDDVERKIYKDYYNSDLDAVTLKKLGIMIDDLLPFSGGRVGNFIRRK